MSRAQTKPDQDDFEVVLSREDYENMKKHKANYEKLKQQLQAQKEMFEIEKTHLVKVNQALVKETHQTGIDILKIELMVERMYRDLEIWQAKTIEINQTKNLPSSETKDQTNPLSLNEESSELVLKLDSSLELMNRLFEGLSMAREKWSENINNLVKETLSLKEANFKLDIELEENNEKMSYLESLRRKREEEVERLNMEIKELYSRINQLQGSVQSQTAQYNEMAQEKSLEVTSLQQKLQSLSLQNQFLQKQIAFEQQESSKLQKQCSELQDEIKEYQEHILMLKQSIKLSSRQKEHSRLGQQQGNKTPGKSKFEKEDFIKETLVEYMREIRRNLISIGNLSQEEIRQIGTSELRTLVKFIQELQEDFE